MKRDKANKADQTVMKLGQNSNRAAIKERNHAEDRPLGKTARNKLQRKSYNEVNHTDETA